MTATGNIVMNNETNMFFGKAVVWILAIVGFIVTFSIGIVIKYSLQITSNSTMENIAFWIGFLVSMSFMYFLTRKDLQKFKVDSNKRMYAFVYIANMSISLMLAFFYSLPF